jgi:hypothetical protein
MLPELELLSRSSVSPQPGRDETLAARKIICGTLKMFSVRRHGGLPLRLAPRPAEGLISDVHCYPVPQI